MDFLFILKKKKMSTWHADVVPCDTFPKTETGSLADTYLYVDWQSLP